MLWGVLPVHDIPVFMSVIFRSVFPTASDEFDHKIDTAINDFELYYAYHDWTNRPVHIEMKITCRKTKEMLRMSTNSNLSKFSQYLFCATDVYICFPSQPTCLVFILHFPSCSFYDIWPHMAIK